MNFLIVFAAQYLFLASVIIAAWFFLTLPDSLKKTFAIFTLTSFAVTFVTAKLLSIFFYDPRPFISDHVRPLISHIADNGFPSDHMLLTMAIASVVFVYNRRLGMVLAIISGMVGFSRILAGIHHPIDIIGGMIIPAFCVTGTKKLMKITG